MTLPWSQPGFKSQPAHFSREQIREREKSNLDLKHTAVLRAKRAGSQERFKSQPVHFYGEQTREPRLFERYSNPSQYSSFASNVLYVAGRWVATVTLVLEANPRREDSQSNSYFRLFGYTSIYVASGHYSD